MRLTNKMCQALVYVRIQLVFNNYNQQVLFCSLPDANAMVMQQNDMVKDENYRSCRSATLLQTDTGFFFFLIFFRWGTLGSIATIEISLVLKMGC